MASNHKGTNVVSVTSGDDEDYRTKRERNNEAVKRSRVKSKQRTQRTQARVKELKIDNQVMEEKIENLAKDMKFLKDLLMSKSQTNAEKLDNERLRRILAEDDADAGASTSRD